ncbi:hypothetical protein D3C72_2146710 [compost metagenome]
MVPMLMIRPKRCARMPGTAACTVLSAPRTLPSNWALNACQPMASALARASPLNENAASALLTTQPSARPKCAPACATIACTWVASVTSARTASVEGPSSATSAWAASALCR